MYEHYSNIECIWYNLNHIYSMYYYIIILAFISIHSHFHNIYQQTNKKKTAHAAMPKSVKQRAALSKMI